MLRGRHRCQGPRNYTQVVMKNLSFARVLLLLFISAILLAACGSDGSSDEAVEATVDAVTADDSDTADDAADVTEPEDNTEAIEEAARSAIEEAAIPDGAQIDDRTEEEIVRDNLDAILIRLSVEVADLDPISDCIIDRLDGEGVLVTGDGAAEIVALVGCEPGIIGNILGVNPAVADAATRQCALGAIGDWFSSIPLLEAEVVLQAPEPPQSVRDQIVSECDVDDATATAILG